MEIINDSALKVSLPKQITQEILARIPKSQLMGDGEVLLNWGYEETMWLAYYTDLRAPNALMALAPSPMLRDYTWPGIYTPFAHQKTVASFLSLRARAFCFSEMGTGKTGSAIWAADYLMTLGMVKRVLVICPLSIMQTAWVGDIFKTAMHRSVGVAYGSAERRTKVIKGQHDFVVINFDGVATVKDVIDKAGFDLIIIDEATSYKNTSTKRWRTLASLIKPSTRLWLMTGTPAAQSPVDAFGLAKLVSPYRVPKFVTAWKDKVMLQIRRFTWVPKTTAQSDVFYALQPAIRFTKKECLDLPDIVYEMRDVPLTPQVAAYYKKLKTQLLIDAAGEKISAVNAGVAMNKLLQISGGALYSDAHNVVEFDVSTRLEALEEVLDECANKAIVFVNFLHTIDVVSRHLTAKGHAHSIIKGDVTKNERERIITEFQNNPQPRVLLAQPRTTSHGITLTAADTVIFWGPVLSVETFTQCVARIDRMGQVHKMLCVMLQGSDVERKVYAALRSMLNDHLALVDLYKQVMDEE